MSSVATNLTDESREVQEDPTATRTGVWAIRPDQALRWAGPVPTRAQAPPLASSALKGARALGVLSAVVIAGMLGGVGAWALTA